MRAPHLLLGTIATWLSLGAITEIETACSQQQVRTADQVADAALLAKDVACIMGSFLVDPTELARACGFVDRIEQLLPVVRGLVGVRDAARRTGVVYASEDAGR